ncbi:MAG: cupin domain-containing protein [Caldilineae bacterium]|nr:MAG: cupin domain-containing protein [Caldilineae bacterium]
MTHRVIKWPYGTQVSEEELRRQMLSEGLHPYTWSNGPNFQYSAHTHSYTKVLYVVRGAITFHLPDSGEDIALHPGDRLDLPARTPHAATVGPEGVVCLEAAVREPQS